MRYLIISVVLLTTALFTSCSSDKNKTANKEQTNDHGHSHARPDISRTIFSDGYELFVEFPALIANEPSKFNAHFTKLDTYKPVEDASVTVELIKQATNTVKQSASKGIYQPRITPKKTGDYYTKITLKTKENEVFFFLGELTVFSSEMDSSHAAHEEHGEVISFLKEQAWNGEFGVEETNKRSFNEIIRCTGEIEPSIKDEIQIIAPVSGIISVNSNMLAGKKLSKGGALAYISGDMFEDNVKSKYLQAQSEYTTAKNNYRRAEQLAKEKIISQRELDELRTVYVTTQSKFKNLSKNYSSKGKNIVAPKSGVLAKVLISEGEYLEAGQLIATMHIKNNYMLRADLPKMYANKTDLIFDANFQAEYSKETFSINELGGKRISTSQVTNDHSGFIPVYFEVPYYKNLIAHSYSDIFLKAKTSKEVITVANTALMESEGVFWIYTQLEGEAFEKREVKLGDTDGKRTVIIEGLKEGEYVVVKGTYRVKQASMSTSVPAHVH